VHDENLLIQEERPMDFKGKTPDITPAQWTAVVGALIALAAAFGLNISHEKRDALLNVAQVIFPVLVAADAIIRHGRSRLLMPTSVTEPPPHGDEYPAATRANVPDGDDAAHAAAYLTGTNGGVGPAAYATE
jgi:hypothetical protein